MNKNKFLIFMSCLLFIGCGATGPVYNDAPKPPVASEQAAILHVFRTGPFLLGTTFSIDDVEVLSIPNNSYSWFEIKPGIHHFEVNASAGAPTVHLDRDIKSGVEYYMHLSVSGAIVKVSLVDKDFALSTIKTQKYAKPVFTRITTDRK